MSEAADSLMSLLGRDPEDDGARTGAVVIAAYLLSNIHFAE